jgi:hypothetical protein
LNRDDIYISESTFHYNGGGCCWTTKAATNILVAAFIILLCKIKCHTTLPKIRNLGK